MLEALQSLPPDPLLGIIERFREDTNPNKLDLGVGIYKDENGQTPVLASVKQAEYWLLENQHSKAYLGAMGNQQFASEMLALALGKSNAAVEQGRVAALQTPGGCGALRVIAELVMRANPKARLWVSDPTWANHVPLLGDAGIEIKTYPYYDSENNALRFEQMCSALEALPPGDIVLLHACCHNPSGADLSKSQWDIVVDLMVDKGLIPFIDMAYQGLGDSLDEDAYGLRAVIEKAPEALFAISCSKNFGLYRDRVGLAGALTSTQSQRDKALSNMTKIVRGIYSMPPDHGAAVVARVLENSALRSQWIEELTSMRQRIKDMRSALVSEMASRGHAGRFDFVMNEKGMFSFLGISPEQVEALAQRFSIYMVSSSRMSIAGLNERNLPYFADSLANVL